MMVEHIEERNGGLYVTGKRVSLDSIVYAFNNGATPESIQERFAGLTAADVFGAISYYLDHQAQVDAYLQQHHERMLQLEATLGDPVVELRARAAAVTAKATESVR
jgi:uncharacterized protein (DUF433 family)